MMIYRWKVWMAWLSSLFVAAGAMAQASPACDCLCDFEYLKQYVETNHPGFADQVPESKRADYERHADSIRAVIRKGDQGCLASLRAFTAYIRDRHMSLGFSGSVEDSPELIERLRRREGLDRHERILLNDATLQRLRGMPDDAVEGIYRNADAGYVVAVVADTNGARDYAGVIVSSTSPLWQPGMVKWTLKRDGSDYRLRFWLRYFDEQVQRWDGKPGSPLFGSFFKESHFARSSALPAREQTHTEGWPFAYRNLNDSVAYMQIPSFGGHLYSRFEKAYREVLPQMEKLPYWILDIRGNGGGADQCLQALVPYLYTDTMWTDVVDIYVTPANIERHTRTLQTMQQDSQSYSAVSTRMWAAENQRMRQAKPNTYLIRGANKPLPVVLKEVKPMPRQVVILYDRGSASSAETLILTGMESGKVTTLGENSFGATGYGEVSGHALPGGIYQLNLPMTRYRDQVKYDTVGIPPMVRAEPGRDWVAQALELFGR